MPTHEASCSPTAWENRGEDALEKDEPENLLSVNLDLKNPRAQSHLERKPPTTLVKDILAMERKIIETIDGTRVPR